MAKDYIPRPDTRFHAWQNNVVTNVNGQLGDLGLAACAMGGEICAKVGDPSSTPPPPCWPPQKTQR